jgi:two-component system, chemotaxis family, protein-glutamate methylesterase/glutaminase
MNCKPTASRDIVVIGASAGGIDTICRILGALPADFPAALFIVLHTGAHPNTLPELFDQAGPLPAAFPRDGLPFAHGRIYVAPPDHHMLLEPHGIRLDRGPKQHFTRPAADPLFRSAASAYGPRVIGVVLTGGDGDGAEGLRAIRACGGVAIVQAPHDAKVPQMPEQAIRGDDPDYCVPSRAIAPLLIRLSKA